MNCWKKFAMTSAFSWQNSMSPCPASFCTPSPNLPVTPDVSWLPTSAVLCWSSHEKTSHVQGKRNPSKMVGAERGHQWADRLRPQSQTTSQSDHTTTVLPNSMELSHAVWGHPRWMGHDGEVWQNVVHWRREWQTTSVFLPWEPHEPYEKAKW